MSEKIFKFDDIEIWFGGRDLSCSKRIGNFTLKLLKMTNSLVSYHIFLSDDLDIGALFGYTKYDMGYRPIAFIEDQLVLEKKLTEHISGVNKESDRFLKVTNENIYLLSLYLGGYLNKKTNEIISKELIDMAYDLLITLHNKNQFTIEGKKTDEKRRSL